LIKDLDQIHLLLLTNFCLHLGTEKIYILLNRVGYDLGVYKKF
jgi:hypothetical protein